MTQRQAQARPQARHRRRKKRKTGWLLLLFTLLLLAGIGFYFLDRYNLLPGKTYTGKDFGIAPVLSSVDFNGNGIDDYTDFLLGAKKDAENHPTYNGAYYAGGYPPENIGVCTDVIWRAFREAGYSLRDMVDRDIYRRPEAYPKVTHRDANIDFRRVGNLYAFFKEYAVELTLDTSEIEEWQPGDIVFFGNEKHIGLVSDKRNGKGEPYILHNGGQPNREENLLKRSEPTGHFRFDASLVASELLIAWSEG